MKLVLMADGPVGRAITQWLVETHRDDIGLVVTVSDNEISGIARAADIPTSIFTSSDELCAIAANNKLAFDLGVLVWWPKLLKGPLLRLPRQGFINTHPSLLPRSRGKHANFWTIVEEAPFGVSLHFVDEGVDSGDIVAQADIPYSWEDTGASLYAKGLETMERLFRDTYPRLRAGSIERRPQDLSRGSLHTAAEMEPASRIDLNKHYTARELLNLLRARTFPGHPACSFTGDDGEVFEVRVAIQRKPA